MSTLLLDGDDFEKHYWSEFLEQKFSSYEKYWSINIVPMTNRPDNIHFKNSSQLISEGFTVFDICKAQLHYTTLRHLVRAYEIKKFLRGKIQTVFDTDVLAEGLFHLAGAQDVAFEFLQRVYEPDYFDPMASMKSASSSSQPASKEAREKWQKMNNNPLKEIRYYRNHLTHGRLSPSLQSTPKVLIPKIGLEKKYLDWRLVTDWNEASKNSDIRDFDCLDNILEEAWEQTIRYFETEWQKII
jgi:hypothetical protein